MQKALSLILILIVLIIVPVTYVLLVGSEYNAHLNENTHTSAVENYWYKVKQSLIEGKEVSLPIKNRIETLDYYIGNSSLENGTYYFQTLLVVNNTEIHVETAVKPNNGIWEVDIVETFMLSHSSTLSHYMDSFLKDLEYLNLNLKEEYVWGMGEGYSKDNEKYLRGIIATRLKGLEDNIMSKYVNKE